MTFQEFRISRAKLERFHSEARDERLANAIRRVRFATWLRDIADRLVAA